MKYSLNDCVKRALSIRCVFEISVKFEEFEIQELQKIHRIRDFFFQRMLCVCA